VALKDDSQWRCLGRRQGASRARDAAHARRMEARRHLGRRRGGARGGGGEAVVPDGGDEPARRCSGWRRRTGRMEATADSGSLPTLIRTSTHQGHSQRLGFRQLYLAHCSGGHLCHAPT
jgi:hypothetical protein